MAGRSAGLCPLSVSTRRREDVISAAEFTDALVAHEDELDIGHTDLIATECLRLVDGKDMLTERAGEEFFVAEQFVA